MGFITDILKEVPLSAVLRERLTEADKKVEALEAKIRELEAENGQLRAQFKHPPQVVQLDDTSRKALQYFCDYNNVVTVQELAGHFSCQGSKAQFICDGLHSKGFIDATSISNIDPRFEGLGDNSGYEITPDGRKLCFGGVA